MVLAASFIGGNVSLTSSCTVRDFSHRAVEISHPVVNPPTKCIISGIPHGETLPCGVREIRPNSTITQYRLLFDK
jgi:hypothetical protein